MLCCVCEWCLTRVVLCLFVSIVVSNTCCVVFVCEWWCLTHVVLCLFVSGGV